MKNCLDQQAEDGREAEHSLLAAGAWKPARVQGSDGGLPFDGSRYGAVMDDALEVAAFRPPSLCSIS